MACLVLTTGEAQQRTVRCRGSVRWESDSLSHGRRSRSTLDHHHGTSTVRTRGQNALAETIRLNQLTNGLMLNKSIDQWNTAAIGRRRCLLLCLLSMVNGIEFGGYRFETLEANQNSTGFVPRLKLMLLDGRVGWRQEGQNVHLLCTGHDQSFGVVRCGPISRSYWWWWCMLSIVHIDQHGIGKTRFTTSWTSDRLLLAVDDGGMKKHVLATGDALEKCSISGTSWRRYGCRCLRQNARGRRSIYNTVVGLQRCWCWWEWRRSYQLIVAFINWFVASLKDVPLLNQLSMTRLADALK